MVNFYVFLRYKAPLPPRTRVPAGVGDSQIHKKIEENNGGKGRRDELGKPRFVLFENGC